jgi:transcriptional activator Myb
MRCVLKEQGTHWANIRKMLKGRSDNCVKNHYYSTVRKTLRWVYREVEAARKNDPLLAGFHSEVALLI